MEIIRYADLKPQRWRNGSGVTRQVASHPKAPSAQDGAWDWRVSIGDVSKAGDFSPFPGMDRLLTVVEGELLLLTVDGAEHPLEKYRPFRFPGGAATSAKLPTGDIRNLNVITRTGKFMGYTFIIELSKKRAKPLYEGQLGILLQGQATAGVETQVAEALARYDAVVGSDVDTPDVLGRGFLAVVSIDPVNGQD